MRKFLFLLAFVTTNIFYVEGQSINDSFFDKVSFIGAFGTEDWTAGWSNFDPQNTDYPNPTSTLGNGELSYAAGHKITTNTTISGVVKLSGWVYVKDGATLTIEKGTIIRGESGSALIIERGGKIIAEGTKTEPIVFTSLKPAGSRAPSDWAGLIICGKAPNNKSDNTLIEGGVGAYFGGTEPNDNSGILKFVRIEFPGYDVDGSGNEINGLTMGSVGSETTIDFVQVSFSGDDAFEWFGGGVNCKHIIALATEDDDFDSDNGYVGRVQYALVIRDPNISDTDGARGFESDNDASSSYNKPYTSAVFSNVTLLGPGSDNSSNQKHDVALLLRRNTRLQIYNLFSTSYLKGGLVIDGDGTQKAAEEDSLIFRNSILAGYGSKFISTKGTSNPLSDPKAWFFNGNNDTVSNLDNIKIQYPINLTTPSFVPQAGSILLSKGSSFGAPVSSITIQSEGNKNSIKTNETLQLTASVSPANAATKDVVWSIESGNDVASVSESGLVTPLKAGNVTIKATAKDGSGTSATFSLEVTTDVAVNYANKSISIWPNPATDIVTIQSEYPIISIELYSITGQVAYKLTGINNISTRLNIAEFNNGVYFLKVATTNGNVNVYKLIKK